MISYKISLGMISRMLRAVKVDGPVKFSSRSSTELSEMPFTTISLLAQHRGHAMRLTKVHRLTEELWSSELALRFKVGVVAALDCESQMV